MNGADLKLFLKIFRKGAYKKLIDLKNYSCLRKGSPLTCVICRKRIDKENEDNLKIFVEILVNSGSFKIVVPEPSYEDLLVFL